MNKFVLLILAFVIALFIFVNQVSAADPTCQPIYGGGQTCAKNTQVSINNTVQNPSTKQFVSGLSIADPVYKPGQKATFHIDVKNTGDAELANVNISDTLPQYISYVSGPGIYDPNTNMIKFTVDKLNPGQNKTYTVVGNVVSQDKLPQGQGTVCVTGGSQAVTTDGQTSQDNTQLCIGSQTQSKTQLTTKGGLPVLTPTAPSTTPPTGPEDLALLGLIPTGVVGLLLRKKS